MTDEQGTPPQGDSALPVEQPQLTFRERTMQRLTGEGDADPTTGETEDIREDQEHDTDAHQPDEGYPDDSDDGVTEDDTTDGVEDSDDEVDEYRDEEPALTELRERAEKAEESVSSMQRDYTQKTQKLAESRKLVTEQMEQSERIAGIYATQANTQLNRYSNVNWQSLQSSLDPQEYNKRVAEYRQVVAHRDRAVGQHDKIRKYVIESIEKGLSDQAAISKDILHTTVPGWGDKLYGQLREFAVNHLDFTESEFDDIRDHKIIRLIHTGWTVSDTDSKVKNIRQRGKSSGKKPAGRNKERPKGGADGRFQRAQQNHVSKPGDRDATRSAFQERLRRERTRR